ncbi:MAG: pyridoxal phosphate-dependent aminotransferase [Ramlibacter sp.]|nr:pyridoxal phosphate-dependent aminotransferase [Ramlibacter sp.]
MTALHTRATDAEPATAEGMSDRASTRVRRIQLSPTIAIAGRAGVLRSAGRDVISLALGELDFDTPARIVEAAHKAALEGFTRYTAADGAAPIKDAVREKFRRDHGLSRGRDEIHVASGCKQVIFNALAATLDPGDEVVIFAPYWVSYCDLVEFCDGKAVVIQTSGDNGFLPDPSALRRALSARTRWVFINTPNNPTGAIYPSALLAELAEVIRNHSSAMVLSDEIYEHLAFDGNVHVPFTLAAPRMRERTLVASGVSKTYAMTGWRIGYAAGPTWLIDAMARVQSQTAGNACSIAQAAAVEAIAGDQTLIGDWLNTLQRRRNRALAILAKTPLLKVSAPAGAFYIFADVSACLGRHAPDGGRILSDSDLAEHLLMHANVAAVPGCAFGASPFIRISFVIEESLLAQACERIVDACNALQHRQAT